jgi:hypothetical protein
MVDAAIGDKLGWIFREQTRTDLGIDAQTEVVQDGTGTGRLLALQIKCGPSWFDEEVDGGWIYRGEQKHLAYWTRHSLPVLVCLCDPETDSVYWVQITESNATRTEMGWKAVVPRAQLLDEGAVETLIRVAFSPQHADIVELLIPSYLQERYSRKIYIHPILETPHDFHGFAYMTSLEHEVMLVDLIYTPMEKLDIAAVDRRIESRAFNERAWARRKTRLHILIVGDNADAVRIDDNVAAYIGSVRDAEVTRLIYQPTLSSYLQEVDEEGRRVDYLPGGDRYITDTAWPRPRSGSGGAGL